MCRLVLTHGATGFGTGSGVGTEPAAGRRGLPAVHHLPWRAARERLDRAIRSAKIDSSRRRVGKALSAIGDAAGAVAVRQRASFAWLALAAEHEGSALQLPVDVARLVLDRVAASSISTMRRARREHPRRLCPRLSGFNDLAGGWTCSSSRCYPGHRNTRFKSVCEKCYGVRKLYFAEPAPEQEDKVTQLLGMGFDAKLVRPTPPPQYKRVLEY